MTMRIQWNLATFKKIRKSPEMQAVLQEAIDKMVQELGDGYEGDVQVGQARARGGVVTATQHAKRENARDNTLLRALGNAGSGSP